MTVIHMLRALQAERQLTIDQLRQAIDEMVAELDPDGLRDHASHWQHELPVPKDLFDRVRWTADELVVLGAQMVAAQPWATPAGRVGLASVSPFDQWQEAAKVIAIFKRLVAREETPLERLEADVKGLQLQRRWYGNDRAGLLPLSVLAMRDQHTAAHHVVRVLERVAA